MFFKQPDKTALKHGEMRSLLILVAAAFILLVILFGLISSAGFRGKAPAETPDQGEKIDGQVRILGTDGKLVIEHVEDPGDPYEKKELPVSKPKPWVEDDRWAEEIIDHDEILEERAFYYLIHKAAIATDDEIDRAADTEIGSLDLLTRPSALRGRPVMVQGDLLSLAKTEFPDNRSGIRYAYHGNIVDNRYKPISFYVFSFPEDIKQRDVIELRGYFYKIWKYRNVRNVEVSSPLIIGRVVKKIPKYPKAEPIRFFGIPLVIGGRNVVWGEIIVVILFVIMVPTFFLLYKSEKKKYEKFRLEQVEKRKQKTQAKTSSAVAAAGLHSDDSSGVAKPPDDGKGPGAQEDAESEAREQKPPQQALPDQTPSEQAKEDPGDAGVQT